MKYTYDLELSNSSEYKIIEQCLQMLEKNQVLDKFSGNCIAASDLISTMLHQHGIESSITECQALLKKDIRGQENIDFVGFGVVNSDNPNWVDTHVIVITKTKIPILIDLSLGYIMPPGHPYIVEKINSLDPSIIAEYEFDKCKITYQPKQQVRWPSLHQKTIVQRIKDDEKIKSKVSFLQIITMIGIGIGVINFLMNSILIYLRQLYQ